MNFKRIILSILCLSLLILPTLIGQTIQEDYSNTAGGVLVLDSSYNYRWDRDNKWDWELSRRTVTVERFSDASAKINVSSIWDRDLEEWIPENRYYLNNQPISPNAVISDSSDRWDAVNERWVLYGKTTNRYNDEGKLLSVISYEWDEVQSKWNAYYKYLIEYRDSSKLVESYSKDPSGSEWRGNSRSVTHYDLNTGSKLYVDRFRWKNKAWKNKSREDYSMPPYIVYYSWDENKTAFIPKSRNYSKIENNIKRIITQKWNEKTKQWDNFKARYDIFSSTQPSRINYSETWEATLNRWFATQRTEYYNKNADGVKKSLTFRRTLTDSTSWVHVNKSFTTLDTANRQLLFESYTWDVNRMDWRGNSKRKSFWGMFISTHTAYQVLDEHYLYPNPAQDKLFIRGDIPDGTIAQIRSINGQVTYKTIFQNYIDVSGFAPGWYILTFQLEGKNWRAAWIKN